MAIDGKAVREGIRDGFPIFLGDTRIDNLNDYYSVQLKLRSGGSTGEHGTLVGSSSLGVYPSVGVGAHGARSHVLVRAYVVEHAVVSALAVASVKRLVEQYARH